MGSSPVAHAQVLASVCRALSQNPQRWALRSIWGPVLMPHGSGLEKALFTGMDIGAQGLEPTRDSELTADFAAAFWVW